MGSYLHMADLSFVCLLNPAANSENRYSYIVHYKHIDSK